MKEYKLIKWYPSLPTEWYNNSEFPIIVVKREDGYHLHPSLKGKTRFAIIPKREVERNAEFWVEVSAEKENIYQQLYTQCINKLNEMLQEEMNNYSEFLYDEGISVLPDGFYKGGKKLDYGEVRRLYDNNSVKKQ